MRSVESLSHTRWECKYHIVFIPKYRKKAIFGQIRKELGEVFHRLARQKESIIEEGHLMPDHVHFDDFNSSEVFGSQVIGFIKGKSCYPYSTGLCWSKKKLCWQKLLGERVLCSPQWVGIIGPMQVVPKLAGRSKMIAALHLSQVTNHRA